MAKVKEEAVAAVSHAHIEYLLHLADNALVLGQRNAEWCGHGPVLEEDIALANISVDLIGQARLLYQHVANMAPTLAASRAALHPEGANLPRGGPSANFLPLALATISAAPPPVTEDTLAYFRDAAAFRNYTLLELPHSVADGERDYAVTIVRNFLYSALMVLVWDALHSSSDPQLAAIAERSVKEARYHLRHSRDWLVRLGDGTAESNRRAQAALDHLMPFAPEFWAESAMENEAFALGVAVSTAGLKSIWNALVDSALLEATLTRPASKATPPQGKTGHHTEHLARLLDEMQSLARQHPEAVW